MNLQAMRLIFDADVAAKKISGVASHQEVYDYYRTENLPGPVPAKDIRKLLDLVDAWAEIKFTAITPGAGSDARRMAAISLVDALDTYEDFDLRVPEHLTAIENKLASCVAEGFFDDTLKAAILALDANRVAPGGDNGMAALTVDQIRTMRTL